MGQNQTAEKILRMGPNDGCRMGLDPSTETPPLFFARGAATNFHRLAASFGRCRARASPESKDYPSCARVCARERQKTVFALKVASKAGCSLEALNFRIPSGAFLYWAGSSLASS